MAQLQFVRLEDRGILAVAGPDRRNFLQGLVSNDVTKLTPERALYAAFLTPQGKYLHDFIMLEHAEEVWLDCEQTRLADLKRRLSVYRLRAKVELIERPALAVAAVFGAGAAAALDLPPEAGAARQLDAGVALVDPRLTELGARLVVERGQLSVYADTVAAADFAAYDRHRLALGIPDGSRDLVPEKSILLEAGFDELHGVDWQKGCYIGQELTARTKYRGLIKKRLFPVRIDGEAPAPGTLVLRDGKEAGELRSARDGFGLALLRLDAIADDRLSAGASGIAPQRPAWMRILQSE
ncbi:MAG: YgfZ/GcvT domain-containing protein [Thiohalocapsa sp.]